jgi:hydrogenase maturation protease
MTLQLPPVHHHAAKAVAVQILVCGSADRGDDGAPRVVADLLRDTMPDDVAIRIVGQLDIDDLLAVPAGAGAVIVDAATGIRPGQVVDLPLTGMIGREDRLRPRSSHALAFPEVVGLADLMRGRSLCGRVVVIGGADFGLGEALSFPVSLAIPDLARAIGAAVDRIRAADRSVPARGG